MKTDRLYTLLLAIILLFSVRTAGAQGAPEIQWMRGLHYADGLFTKFSADGSRFISFASGSVHVYRTSDGMLLRTFVAQGLSNIVCADISADGTLVAIAIGGTTNTSAGQTTVRRIDNGAIINSVDLPPAGYYPSGVSLSPDTRSITIQANYAWTAVVQLQPSVTTVLTDGGNGIWTRICPDNQSFLYRKGPGSLYGLSPFSYLHKEALSPNPLDFSADGSTFMTWDDTDGTQAFVTFTNLVSGNVFDSHQLPRLYTDPKKWSNYVSSAAVGPDGTQYVVGVAYSHTDAALELCYVDVWSGGAVTEHLVSTPGPGYYNAISPDGTTALFSGLDRSFPASSSGYIYRVSGPDFSNPANTFPIPGHGSRVAAVACAPDSSFIASASADLHTNIWSLSGGGGHVPGDLLASLNHGTPVSGVAISPDGKVIATASGDIIGGGSDGSIKFWRISDGALIGATPATGHTCYAITFSPDGNNLAACCQTDGLRIFKVTRAADDSTASATQIDGFTGSLIVPPVYSADGKWLLIGGGRVYQVHADGTIALALDNSHTTLGPACFAPDGLTYASGQDINNGLYPIVICDRATGAVVKTFPGHTSRVNTVAISPDGKFLLSSAHTGAPGFDVTLKIWDIATGHLRKSYDFETGGDPVGGIRSAIFSPDGNNIIYGRQDGTVVVAAMPDLIPPVTTVSVVGSTVTLTATDNKSGVLATYYMLDGGAQQTYTAPFSAGLPGNHTLIYWSTDNAGNTEAQKSLVFTVGIPVTIKVTGVTGQAGTKATVSATIKRSDTNVALGSKTLTFKLDGTTLGTKLTSAAGAASLAITLPDPVGAQALTVEFAGDTTFQPGTGSGTVTVTQANTTVAVSGVSTIIGKKTNLVAKLTRTTGGTTVAGKTITFKVDGTAVGTAVTTTAGTATLVGYKHEAVGSFTLTADFAGDASYAASSGSGSLTVAQSTTTLTVPNKSVKLGKAVILKAVLKRTSDNGLLAGRPVTIMVDGATVETVFTDGTGTASVTYTAVVAGGTGTKTISASFDGDSSYFLSSGTGTLTITP